MFSAFPSVISSIKDSQKLWSDFLAGLTIGIIALPLSMALAIACDVPPQHGLYTAIIAGIVIALSGGSEVNISGPTAAFVVVLIPIVSKYGIGGLFLSTLLAGIFLIFMGLTKMGNWIRLVPYPVTIGFTAGIATVIGGLQLKDFLGLTTQHKSHHFIGKLFEIFKDLPNLNWSATFIGIVTLVILVYWRKVKSRIPGQLIALTFSSLIAYALGKFTGNFSIETIGTRFQYSLGEFSGAGIPPFLPSFVLPWTQPGADGNPIGLSFALISDLMGPALTIAALGAIESLLCAVVADGVSGKNHNPNDELIGQGIGNIIVPFFGGIPATAAIARTAANIRAGGISPLSSVFHSLFIVGAILFFAPFLAYIPMAAMSALLIQVAWNMSETKHFIRIARIAPREDIITLLTCFLLTVVFDMVIAVAVGMGLAAFLFIRRIIALSGADIVRLGKKENREVLDFPDDIISYEINGPLFFGSAQRALQSIVNNSRKVKAIVLDMNSVSMIDMTAIVALETIVEELAGRKIRLIFYNTRPSVKLKLRQAGIRTKLGAIEYSKSIDQTLKKVLR